MGRNTNRRARAHGTYAKYKRDRCRCRACTQANRQYAAARNRLRAYGHWAPYVDAEPVRVHVRELMEAGLGWKRIAVAANVSPTCVSALLYGRVRAGQRRHPRRMRTETAHKLLSVSVVSSLAPSSLVDATGTRRRLQGLVTIGWPFAELSPRLQLGDRQIHRVLKRRRVTAATAAAVSALYDELWNTLPPRDTPRQAAAVRRAQQYAAENAWASPLAWDDDRIDDPAAKPVGLRSAFDAASDSRWMPAAGAADDLRDRRIRRAHANLHRSLRGSNVG